RLSKELGAIRWTPRSKIQARFGVMSPANKAIIDRRRRTIVERAIAPAATTFQHMHDPADDSPIVRSFNTPHIRRQMRAQSASTAHRLAKTGSCADTQMIDSTHVKSA